MADSLADCWVYYGQEELAHLVAKVGETTNEVDLALERQGLADRGTVECLAGIRGQAHGGIRELHIRCARIIRRTCRERVM
jgi:hypothetical protein